MALTTTQKNIQKDIITLSDEWNGYVTCEFSIHADHLPYVKQLISCIHLKNGGWIVRRCPTCVEHHGANSLHVEIVTPEQLKLYNKHNIRILAQGPINN